MYGKSSTDQVANWSAMRAGGSLPWLSWKLWMASPICLRLLLHLIRAAASRTFWTAGRSRPIRMARMAITTSRSISVKADRRGRMCDEPMTNAPREGKRDNRPYEDRVDARLFRRIHTAQKGRHQDAPFSSEP